MLWMEFILCVIVSYASALDIENNVKYIMYITV